MLESVVMASIGEEGSVESEDEENEIETKEPEEVDLVDLEDLEADAVLDGEEDVVLNLAEDSVARDRIHSSRVLGCPLDLPIAVTRRILKSASSKRFSPELISACARVGGVFALYLLSASQEAAIESGRSTIRPIEIIEGLVACGFPEIAEEVRVSMNITVKKKKKKIN